MQVAVGEKKCVWLSEIHIAGYLGKGYLGMSKDTVRENTKMEEVRPRDEPLDLSIIFTLSRFGGARTSSPASFRSESGRRDSGVRRVACDITVILLIRGVGGNVRERGVVLFSELGDVIGV